MRHLLRRPRGNFGKVHDITVENARGPLSPDWGYVGFGLHHLRPGDSAAEATGAREAILVLVEGKARIEGAGHDWGELGERLSVWERTPPHALYLPPGVDWRAVATTDCTLAVCTAPGKGGHAARLLGGADCAMLTRGKGGNTRHIYNIAMEDADVADSLLVTEVFTPNGHWSSYPGHRHDEDDFPRITCLEETYYFRLDRPGAWGLQRVYTEDGTLDEAMAVRDGDVTLVPRGHHPCAAPYGFEMYYLNTMAGPRRNWRFIADPASAFVLERDGQAAGGEEPGTTGAT
ncbi:MAG: 5-deoxy-glucuronate isomerase [Rubellimicrobium sp.]|nr:5-deoxy-glucuronate isomerase [Rubellimicrobium sp.]